LIKSQNKVKNMLDLQSHQDFQIQDPYSIFQVPQHEEPTDLKMSMENLIQPKIILHNLSIG